MKNKFLSVGSALLVILALSWVAYAADLGQASGFAVLGSTYSNTGATTITGDLGFTTPPGVAPTVSGSTHVADGTYNTAGTDQGSALGTLNALPCDFTFGSAQDLSLLSQPLLPGVYCVIGAQSVGTGGITLSGGGTYVFRSTGALDTVADSVVSGGEPCDVFWTPVATTLGANSTFLGTVIDDAGITVGSTVTWTGRALAFGGTVTTDTDTISVPTCATPTATPSPTVAPNGNTGSYVHTPTPSSTPVQTPAPTNSPTPTPNPYQVPTGVNSLMLSLIIALVASVSYGLYELKRT